MSGQYNLLLFIIFFILFIIRDFFSFQKRE